MIFASFSSRNLTPTKSTILQIIKVGNVIKKHSFGEDQMSRNYENQKKKSNTRKAHMSAIIKEVKRYTKKRAARYISSKSNSSKSS